MLLDILILAFGSAFLPLRNRGCVPDIDVGLVKEFFNPNTKYIGGVERYARCWLSNAVINIHPFLRSSQYMN